jgi:hypothetical protein
MNSNKKITKKHITEVLRSRDLTEIYRLVHIINGGKIDSRDVIHFVHEYAPSDKVWDDIWRRIHCTPNREEKYRNFRREVEFNNANRIHIAVQRLREEIERGIDNYTKRPVLGFNHLYFCSPTYGHRDYNKCMYLPIEGYEKCCRLLVKLADKYIPMRDG